jgi:Spy/CpxP family protein refolding chaperone
MKSNIVKYVLVVSLLMNFSFLGAAAYTHYRQVHHYHMVPFSGPGGAPGPHGSFSSGMPFEELSLKPEQAKLFHQKAEVFHSGITEKRRQVERLRVSLLALMRADNRDDKAIGATIARINKEQEEMQKTVVSHMLEFKSMLDKDQQKKFMDMIEGAMGEHKEAICPQQ